MMPGMNKKALALLGLGHLMVDLNTGALPALLPFLKTSFGLSYTMIGALVLVANMTSSIIQPLFGYLSDRSAQAWLLPFGVVAATCGMASVGLVTSYPALLVVVFISGIGIASYHPEAYKTAYLSTGEKKATGISLFSVGGNLGLGLGPLAVAFCLAAFGQSGLLLFWIPGILVGALFMRSLPWLSQTRPALTGAATVAAAIPRSALALVLSIVTLGACVHAGMSTYVPLYLADQGGDTLKVGSVLSLFLIAGAVGTLLGGPLADHIGHKRFLVYCTGPVMPLDLPLSANKWNDQYRDLGVGWDVSGPDVLCHPGHRAGSYAGSAGYHRRPHDRSRYWGGRSRCRHPRSCGRYVGTCDHHAAHRALAAPALDISLVPPQ